MHSSFCVKDAYERAGALCLVLNSRQAAGLHLAGSGSVTCMEPMADDSASATYNTDVLTAPS